MCVERTRRRDASPRVIHFEAESGTDARCVLDHPNQSSSELGTARELLKAGPVLERNEAWSWRIRARHRGTPVAATRADVGAHGLVSERGARAVSYPAMGIGCLPKARSDERYTRLQRATFGPGGVLEALSGGTWTRSRGRTPTDTEYRREPCAWLGGGGLKMPRHTRMDAGHTTSCVRRRGAEVAFVSARTGGVALEGRRMGTRARSRT